MLLIIRVERLLHIGSHFSLRKWRRRRPHFPTKLAAVASFSYKICRHAGGGLIFQQNWRRRQGFGNITGGCSDMVWILACPHVTLRSILNSVLKTIIKFLLSLNLKTPCLLSCAQILYKIFMRILPRILHWQHNKAVKDQVFSTFRQIPRTVVPIDLSLSLLIPPLEIIAMKMIIHYLLMILK